MLAASYLKSLYLCFCARGRADRAVYRRLLRLKPSRIVEIGLGDGSRAVDMIELAHRQRTSPVHYCGIDLFEAREQAVLPLKEAHLRLNKTGAKIRLLPGDLASTITRHANFLAGTDLLVFDESISEQQLERLSPFWLRIVHEGTAVARYCQSNSATDVAWLDPRNNWTVRQAA